MTKEERREVINWMLRQIEAIELADDEITVDGTAIRSCGFSRYVHVFEGFEKLVEAVNEPVKRRDFSETQWEDSFCFVGVTFLRLLDKKFGGSDEEQAE